jgi:hypothetical protein
MSIDLGRLQIRMTHQLLHDTDVDAVFEQVSGKAMKVWQLTLL